jgi:rubrerythrin
MREKEYTKKRCLNLASIEWNNIDPTLVHDDDFLFLTLASASFVEILSEMYANNLIQHFYDDKEITTWLAEYWQKEEVQHGKSLKYYVQTVWPEFDWESSFNAFYQQYSSLCTIDQLETKKSLELIARCVVETGTSSFYRALQHYVQEPILRQILDHIKSDEIMHYNNFRHYFIKYNAVEQHGVRALFMAIWRRLGGIQSQDAYIAFKHVHQGYYPEKQFLQSDWNNYSQTVKRLARDHYPYTMAIKMLLKPIPLFPSIKKMLEWPLVGLAKLLSRS